MDGIFENIGSEDTVTVADHEYTYKKLFMMMVKLHIDTFLYRYEAAEIKKLVISVETFEPLIFSLLSELYKEMGVEKDIIGQAAFLLWQLEEEKRIDENSRNV